MNPTGNAQGGYHFLSLVTGHRLSQQQWDVFPMPDGNIARVEATGALESQPYMGHGPPIFEWSPGIPILDPDADPIVAAGPPADIGKHEPNNADNDEVIFEEPLANIEEAEEDVDNDEKGDGDIGNYQNEPKYGNGDIPYQNKQEHGGDDIPYHHNNNDNDDQSDSNNSDGNTPVNGGAEEHKSKTPNIDPQQDEIPIPLEQRSETFTPDMDQRSDKGNIENNTTGTEEDNNNNNTTGNNDPDPQTSTNHNQPRPGKDNTISDQTTSADMTTGSNTAWTILHGFLMTQMSEKSGQSTEACRPEGNKFDKREM